MSLRHFICMLKAEPWDLVINTHFLPAEIIAALRRQGRIKLPHVLITTDYETHRLWVNQPCEHYFTATEEAARYLECFGVPAGTTTATGIPVLPAFARAKDRATCLARQGLTGDRPIILQLSGGCGVGPFEEVYRAVLQVEPPLEIVVATGHNATLKSRLEEIPTHQHRTKILGYTNQVDELMAIADLIVTKPGGLTTAESLASGLPLVIVYPVPGQEERNSDFLLENGAAIKINHIPTLALKVNEVLRDPAWLTQLKANARRLGRPRAAFEIVERSLSLIRSADGVRSQVMVS